MNPFSILLLAPPSSGKTTFILNYIKEQNQKVLYISPLRSLNREFAKRCADLDHTILSRNSHGPSRVIVSTPESYLIYKNLVDLKNRLVVLDEIHLFFDWGNSFRPKILECLYDLLSSSLNIISLTATMSTQNLRQWRRLGKFQSHETLIINRSNLCLKTLPQRTFDLSNLCPQDIESLIIFEAFYNQRKTLVFVRTKNEAKKYAEIFSRLISSTLYCTSDNMDEFMVKLEENGARLIFCTIALSHGVNLPSVSCLFITYPIPEHSHFIQILARAGRNGESFIAYHKQRISLAGAKLCQPYHLYLVRAVISFLQCLKKILF